MDSNQLTKLYEKLGYQFKNVQILEQAMTHTSYCSESSQKELHNERLEFLGDALLELAISEHLMNFYPSQREGVLSQMRAKLVNADHLSQLAKNLQLYTLIQLGQGEERSGGRKKKSILADAFEALIAAIYLDNGKNFEIIQQISKRLFQEQIQKLQHTPSTLDFKGQLQQYSQSTFQTLPVYHLASESGTDHDKLFKMVVFINATEYGQGTGKSKKQAEQSCRTTCTFSIEL